MAEKMLVGDVVAEFLQACGVTTAFGVISIHNIPMLDAIGRRNAIRFVMSRGEAGGAHMADAYARVSGGLGVIVSSTGPGAANAVPGLVEARFAGTPVLHLTGQTATANVDRAQGAVHDVPDQLGMLASVSKAAYRVRSAESALGTLVRAATEALTPPMGPVSVEIPIDIQRAEIPRPAELDDLSLPLPVPMAPDPGRLERLAGMLSSARRPLLWLGNGARHAGEAARRLTGLGIPLLTSWAGRGVLPEDDAMVLGALATIPEVEEFFATVDLMVIAGSRLKGHEMRDMSLRLPARRAQIDIDPAAEGRTYTTDLFIAADAATTLAALADRLEGKLDIEAGFAKEVQDLKVTATENFRAALGPYQVFPAAIREAMPRDAVFVRDITLNNSTWGNRIFPIYGPRDSVYPISAAIGPGMQLGIGAALGGGGRKVVAMCGDGGFFLNLAELWTAVQERADVVFLVMNDNGYGVIKHIQDRMYEGRHYFGDLQSPDLEALAGVAGIPFERVGQADEMGPVLARAVAVDGPALVEVDMAAIGPYPPYFRPPPFVEEAK